MKHYRNQKHAERIRMEACRCAATVLAGRPTEKTVPLVWSLSVFFEKYIADGASATSRDFGPKRPAKLKIVKGA